MSILVVRDGQDALFWKPDLLLLLYLLIYSLFILFDLLLTGLWFITCRGASSVGLDRSRVNWDELLSLYNVFDTDVGHALVKCQKQGYSDEQDRSEDSVRQATLSFCRR